MSGFVKLDSGILDSTVWVDLAARNVFITALLMAEPYELAESTTQLQVDRLEPTAWTVPPGWYGMVRAAGPGIVRRSGIEAGEGTAALRRLGEPDPESRSHEFEGRRLVRVDGGYIVLNYFKYRDRDYTAAERARRYRQRRLKRVTRDDRDVTGDVTQAEAEAEAEKTKTGRGGADEIAEQRRRYTADQLTIIDAAIADFARTRKAGKIAETVIAAEYRWWANYPPERVVMGLRIYVAKKYAAERKREQYARGIIRNTDPLGSKLNDTPLTASGSPHGDGKPPGLRDSYLTDKELEQLYPTEPAP